MAIEGTKKMDRKDMGYKSISKDELELISRAEFTGEKVLTGEYAATVFGDKKKAAKTLYRLSKKGRLIQIQRGRYFIVPIRAPKQLWMPNEYIAAKYWMGNTPYYIGYFTMYNYWGFTEQIPQILFVLNTAKSLEKTIGVLRFKAVKISMDKYYGIQELKIDGEKVNISDKERTLVDFVYNPLGSFDNLKEVLISNAPKIDMEKFAEYLVKYPEMAVRKRAGYILEKAGTGARFLKKIKKTFDPDASKVVLNPFNKSGKGKIDRNWGLLINEKD